MNSEVTEKPLLAAAENGCSSKIFSVAADQNGMQVIGVILPPLKRSASLSKPAAFDKDVGSSCSKFTRTDPFKNGNTCSESIS